MKVILIMKEDIVQYPPILSLINVLVDLQREVVFIGPYTDQQQKNELKQKGVVFFDKISLNVKAKPICKIYEQLKFRRYVKSVLRSIYEHNDEVCIINEDTVCLLWEIIQAYKYIIYFLETPSYNVSAKYRIYNPTFKLIEACRRAHKIICCEYNRAHIIKGLFQLDELPIVLPNKFFEIESQLNINNIPKDVQIVFDDLKSKTYRKKIILYQGVFNSGERRLEEFILAVKSLPSDYVLLAMGRGDANFEFLKRKYSSSRVIFIDFITPPYHLFITKLAHIGVLSYFPVNKSFTHILNPLYCAPNKIFEYSLYGLPMISNDVPALKNIFKEFTCGEIVEYPISSNKIAKNILKITNNYESYKAGAIRFYNSVDTKKIIADIFNIS